MPGVAMEEEKATYYSDSEISSLEDSFILGRFDTQLGPKGQAYSHYKEVFAAFKTGRAIKWNWCNFLFGSFHLLYRKQFLWGFLSLAATFAFVKFPPYLLIQSLVLGLFGDFLLYQKFCGLCDDGAKNHSDMETMKKLMSRKGGTNVLISVLITIFAVIALVIIALLVWGVGNLAGLLSGLFIPV